MILPCFGPKDWPTLDDDVDDGLEDGLFPLKRIM